MRVTRGGRCRQRGWVPSPVVSGGGGRCYSSGKATLCSPLGTASSRLGVPSTLGI